MRRFLTSSANEYKYSGAVQLDCMQFQLFFSLLLVATSAAVGLDAAAAAALSVWLLPLLVGVKTDMNCSYWARGNAERERPVQTRVL